jgi:hypothetical protein
MSDGIYTYDAETKKISSPDGRELTGGEILSHLNQMFAGMSILYEVWGNLSSNMSVMDAVFMGTLGEDVPDDLIEAEQLPIDKYNEDGEEDVVEHEIADE